MESITKTFPGGIIANHDISLEVYEGEIHSIIGENGAGKTTLMKIISGLLKPDKGKIYVYGREAKLSGPLDAISYKIGMVHQHFVLIPRFTVAENIVLGMEKKKGLNLDKEWINEHIRKISTRYGMEVDPTARIEEIPVGEKQKVEILKVLYRNANIIIFDEPTSVLSPEEIKELFKIFRLLIKNGKTILFISHKLKEVLEISDRITVLRKGMKVGTLLRTEATSNNLAEMMIGNKQRLIIQKEKGSSEKDKQFQIEDLEAKGSTLASSLKNISIKINSGEILGIAGVEGNGQETLVNTIIGIIPPSKGRIIFKGREMNKLTPIERREMGIGIIPSDRQKEGLLLRAPVKENCLLGYQYKKEYYRFGTFKEDYIYEISRKIVSEYDIQPPNIYTKAADLSGGNQQRLILGRELYHNPEFLIAVRPTRGLDLKSTIYIHNKLIEMKNKGTCILLISYDLDELTELSDKIAVIYEGKIIDSFINTESEKSKIRIGVALGGVKYEITETK